MNPSLINILPFIGVLCLFLCTSLIDTLRIKLSGTQKYFTLYGLLCIMILFAGCRWSPFEAGYDKPIFDYDTYHYIFQSLHITSFIDDYTNGDWQIKGMEIGYLLLSALLNTILLGSYPAFLIIISGVTVIIFYLSLKNNQITSGLFFILFFFVARLYFQNNFILMRSGIAIVIAWHAYSYILKENLTKYYLFIIIACLFHTSAALALFAPILYYIRIQPRFFYICAIICGGLSICGAFSQLIQLCLNSLFSAFPIPDIGDKLLKYLDDDNYRQLNILNFIECLPFLYMLHRCKKVIATSKVSLFFRNMAYIYILLLIITSEFGFLTRMIQYFMFSYLYILSLYIKEEKMEKNKTIVLSCLSLYLCIYAIRYFTIWFYDTPYRPFFLQM